MPAPTGHCAIWGTPAEIVTHDRSVGAKIVSLRTGGEYRITAEAMKDYPNLTSTQKALITTWLVEQRRFGQKSPLLDSDSVEEILKRRPLKFSEQRERFFLALSAACESAWKIDPHLGDIGVEK